MPCEYCGYYDHQKNDCPVVRMDQRRDAMIGRIMLWILSPFVVVGAILGLVYTGLRAGFMGTCGLWDRALSMVRKKPDPPEAA